MSLKKKLNPDKDSYHSHGIKGLVTSTKSFVNIGIAKIFVTTKYLVLSTKRLVAAAKFLVAATKKYLLSLIFVAVTKPFFPCSHNFTFILRHYVVRLFIGWNSS